MDMQAIHPLVVSLVVDFQAYLTLWLGWTVARAVIGLVRVPCAVRHMREGGGVYVGGGAILKTAYVVPV